LPRLLNDASEFYIRIRFPVYIEVSHSILVSTDTSTALKMKVLKTITALGFIASTGVWAARIPFDASPFEALVQRRQSSCNSTSSTIVDLGYSVYEGFLNSTTGLNTFLGNVGSLLLGEYLLTFEQN
jgi:hypothetical protein